MTKHKRPIELTAEIIYRHHKTGCYYETFLKCMDTGIIYYYRGDSFAYKFKIGDIVSFEARLKKKRSKPIKFEYVKSYYRYEDGKWLGKDEYENIVIEYSHNIWYPKNIVKI